MAKKLFVIGGGISGLSTAYRLRQRLAGGETPPEIHLLESEERLGGKIRSERSGGYLVEWGPNGFLDNKPDTLKLCRDLGLDGELLPSTDAAGKRYIFSSGVLHRVPEGPVNFFRSPLLSLGGRLRILKEPWAPVTPDGLDTSIAEFGRRRLGREAMEKLLDPMVSGIFAGDPAVMSLASCFPRIAELERDHGSLIRAMVSLARERKKQAKNARQESGVEENRKTGERGGGGPAGQGGTLTSFKGGMGCLVDALEQALGDAVRVRTRVEKILYEPEASGRAAFRILCREQGAGREYRADAVVLAVPAHQALGLLQSLEPGVSRLLRQIPYAPLAMVGLGFPEDAAPGLLDGFGFLVPYQEALPVLGSLWTSSIFSQRAPAGCRFTRNMVGGWRNGWPLTCEEKELEEMVLGVLEKALGGRGKVGFRKVVRHPEAIPLYGIGHGGRLQEIEDRLKPFPGLYLTGNAYRGVALNDCTREAERTARRVEADLLGAGVSWGRKHAGE